jgi:hypothetical protein
MMDSALEIIERQNKLIEDLQSKNKMEICKYQRQVTHSENLQGELSAAKEMNTENLRLLDSYMETNARQAQDIIELESVAIALYDVLWHMVYSVEDELKDKSIANLNAYKTIVALFEAEGEAE